MKERKLRIGSEAYPFFLSGGDNMQNCATCKHDPTNHGQRAECKWETLPDSDEDRCTEEKGYPQYEALPQDHLYPKYCC